MINEDEFLKKCPVSEEDFRKTKLKVGFIRINI